VRRKKERKKGTKREPNILFRAEHMEADDPTPRALPRWVELEYNVSKKHEARASL
jgi:hypothetical protein